MSEIEIFMKNIAFMRKQNGLSITDMADIMHITEEELCMIERGVWPDEIEVVVMVHIQRYFGIGISEQFLPLF